MKQFYRKIGRDVSSTLSDADPMGKQYFWRNFWECANVAVVDIGWAGSGAVSLDYLINEVWGNAM